MTKAYCDEGPLGGREFESRFPLGFLVVNREVEEVAVYKTEGGRHAFKGYETLIWDEGASDNIRRAAEEPHFDVVAYDPEEMQSWRQ